MPEPAKSWLRTCPYCHSANNRELRYCSRCQALLDPVDPLPDDFENIPLYAASTAIPNFLLDDVTTLLAKRRRRRWIKPLFIALNAIAIILVLVYSVFIRNFEIALGLLFIPIGYEMVLQLVRTTHAYSSAAKYLIHPQFVGWHLEVLTDLYNPGDQLLAKEALLLLPPVPQETLLELDSFQRDSLFSSLNPTLFQYRNLHEKERELRFQSLCLQWIQALQDPLALPHLQKFTRHNSNKPGAEENVALASQIVGLLSSN